MLDPLRLFNLEPISFKAIFLPLCLGVACRVFADSRNRRNNPNKSVDYGEQEILEKAGFGKERKARVCDFVGEI
jgi:hypothetical protein